MSLYKDRYTYDSDEDVIFGGWAITLASLLGIGTLGLTFFSYQTTLDYLDVLGVNRDKLPTTSFCFAMIAGAFAAAFGILNFLAYARRFNTPKLPKPNLKQTYKFGK